MKQKIHALATALGEIKQKAKGFFMLKAESLKQNVMDESSKKQLTQGLPQPALHKSRPSGFAMTGEGGAVRFSLMQKAKSLKQKAVDGLKAVQLTQGLPQPASHQADASDFAMTGEGGGLQLRSKPNSNDLSLPKNSALSVAVKVKNFLHCHCSKWRSGEFFGDFFAEKKLLALPPAMRRGDFNSKNKSKNRDNRESSKKLLSNRLSLRPSAEANASLITMTGEGGAVRFNLMQKAESKRLKEVGESSKKQLTQGLLLRPSARADASLITMTGEGGGLQLRSNPNSNDLSLPKNSALSVAVKVKNFLHCHCSKWRSGEFFGDFFAEKKLLAFPPAMRREDFNSKNKSKKRDNRESSKKLLSNRLSLRPSARADASLITMTGEGGGLQLRSNPNSNDLSLPKNSALSVAVKVKNFLHCHCSKWRSGEFIQFAYCFLKAFMHPLRSSLVTFFGKKELAFPPAMRRGDFNSTNKSKNRDN
ncbi:hypothetical protein, partial [Pedobacter arcticus]|uniref:hypothetical protein n=1 Tax=Pedobacter arcticus TaxID=752140 RepID=UPI001872C1A4